MKHCANIVISAKDCQNYNLLIIINKFNDSSMFLNIFNEDENKLITAEEIKNKCLLTTINAFLADAKNDEFELEDSDYSELYIKYVEFITYFIISEQFSASVIYDDITLIDIKEY